MEFDSSLLVSSSYPLAAIRWGRFFFEGGNGGGSYLIDSIRIIISDCFLFCFVLFLSLFGFSSSG